MGPNASERARYDVVVVVGGGTVVDVSVDASQTEIVITDLYGT